MYPGKAKSLGWNEFYPCQVIGVIKYICETEHFEMVRQDPYVKKYSGGLTDLWTEFRNTCKATEHTKDAFLHLMYYLHSKKEPL
jgi:hypothetical protein